MKPEVFMRCELEEKMRSEMPPPGADQEGGAEADGGMGSSAMSTNAGQIESFLHACGKHKDGGGAANLPTAQAMLSMGMDINVQDESGWTGLHHARSVARQCSPASQPLPCALTEIRRPLVSLLAGPVSTRL
jgi:hypothetical protein